VASKQTGIVPRLMTRTPWGDADQLRQRMLRPGRRQPPEVVAQNQCERLFAATVTAVAERGYENTPVSELLALSGVSRTTFYEHFPSGKEECFLATVDAILATTTDSVRQASGADGSWNERLQRGFDAFVTAIVDQPAAARLCLIDIYACGPTGLLRAEQAANEFQWLLTRAFGASPERASLPPTVVAGIVGGVRTIAQRYVLGGRPEELPKLTNQLRDWALSYEGPPVPIRRPRSRPPAESTARFIVHDQVERIFEAVATTVLEKGYPAMTLDDIAKNASASLTTFYQHFGDKEEAFLAAYDTAFAQAAAAALPPFRWARDWPTGIRAGLEAFLSFLAAEPEWAKLGMVDVLSVGARGLEHRDETLAIFRGLLLPGYEIAPDASPLASDAIGGAIHALIYNQIRRRGAEHLLQILPAATFMALAPYVGAEEAVAVANRGNPRTHRDGKRGNSSGQAGNGGRAGGQAAPVPPKGRNR
jgi:AcrR family transcriptional regulator